MLWGCMSVEDSLSSLKLVASMSSFYGERILASLSLLLGYEFPYGTTILRTLSIKSEGPPKGPTSKLHHIGGLSFKV